MNWEKVSTARSPASITHKSERDAFAFLGIDGIALDADAHHLVALCLGKRSRGTVVVDGKCLALLRIFIVLAKTVVEFLNADGLPGWKVAVLNLATGRGV